MVASSNGALDLRAGAGCASAVPIRRREAHRSARSTKLAGIDWRWSNRSAADHRAHGGAALIVDYGYDADAGFGETLQAVGKHKFAICAGNARRASISRHMSISTALARAARGRRRARALDPSGKAIFSNSLGIVARGEKLAERNPNAMQRDHARRRPTDQCPIRWGRCSRRWRSADRCADAAGILRCSSFAPNNLSTHRHRARIFRTHGRRFDGHLCLAQLRTRLGRRARRRDREPPARCRRVGRRALVKLVTLYQIHSAPHACAVDATPWETTSRPQADAMATATPGIALGILTADCAPVLFADPQASVIGAAHAGWKGALGGVIESVLAAMEKLGADRARIAAAIGPCIAQENYEVGPEFRDRVCRHADSANARFFVPSDKADHCHFDLEAYVAHRLAHGGHREHRSASCRHLCARDAISSVSGARPIAAKPNYGRQISAIALTK